MKKIITLTLVFVMVLMQSVSAATMYALDGRTIEVDDSEIEAYRQVNWYYGKPVTMYALDGRTLTVGENDVEMYKAVGWYYGKLVTMYSADGRTLIIGENEIETYRQVNWYYGKPVTMYAPDGRSAEIPYYEIPAWQKVGWYMVPVQTLYTLDGRSAVFPKSEVNAQLTVGWYTTKNPYNAAYASVLKNHYYSGESFSLVYINNDIIPELVIHEGDDYGDEAIVYTFHNGKAAKVFKGGQYGDIIYRKKGNLFASYFGGAGANEVNIYRISGGYAEGVCCLLSDVSNNPYKVNSRAVSYSTFLSTAKSYYFNMTGMGYLSTENYSYARQTNDYYLNYTNISILFE